MSGNFLNIGLSGLIGAQTGLQNTSHNIANVNTDGYSRQRGEFITQPPLFKGVGYLGNGVRASSVFRVIDERINLELRSNISGFNQADTLYNLATQVDEVVAHPDIGLSGALEGFFSAVHNLNDDPASLTARQILLNESDTMVQRFNLLENQINDQLNLANDDIVSYTQEINRLGESIARMNVQIASVQGDSQQAPPNDLLDRRDLLIKELSELVDVTTLRQDNGAINVFIGKGVSLVTGGVNQEMVSGINNLDGDMREVYIRANSGALVRVTDSLGGGKIGGALEFVNDIAIPALNTLGLVAIGLADTINSQHQLGMDLNNDLGGNFFADVNSADAVSDRVYYQAGNAGTAVMNTYITSVADLTGSDYEVEFDGSNYSVTRLSDNQVVASFAEPGAFPTNVALSSEGFSIEFTTGGAQAGDTFKIVPTRDGAKDIDVSVVDPNAIAWAAPVDGERAVTNTGSGLIERILVTDTTNAAFTTSANQLSPPLQIVFTSASNYDVIDANTNTVLGSGVFTPGQDNDMLALAGLNFGYEVTINGAPEANDQFDINYNTGGVSDNRNGLLIANYQKQKIMSNGSQSIVDVYSNLVGRVGAKTNAAGIEKDATKALVEQYQARRESVSGVSLDEEAAQLIQFQQAYQASAQIISVARTVFDTLFQSVR